MAMVAIASLLTRNCFKISDLIGSEDLKTPYQCELLDEFSERGGPCPKHSSCLPTAPGEWKCICDLGYYANNKGSDKDHKPDCLDIDECAPGTFGADGPYRSDVDSQGIH